MAERTQTSRQIAIATPLGEDVLLFRHATITEYLGRMFQMEEDVFSAEPFKFSDIVGQNATIRLEQRDGNIRYFNGFVTRIMHTGGSERVAHYRLTLSPWLWFLTRTSDCRIFQKIKVPDIIVQVFREKGFTDFSIENLHGTYTEREYCVQYRETDFNFVSRLMEEEGIYYYFKYEDGKHTLMLCDSSASHAAYPGYEKIPYFPPNDGSREQEYIWEWQIEQEVQPGKYAVTDYNFQTPGTDLSNTSTMAREHATPDFEMFDYHPGRYKESGERERVQKTRLDEYQASHEIVRGEGNVRGMSCGCTITIEGHSDAQDGKEHLVTSVVHELESDDFSSQDDGDSDAPIYECTFTAILGSQQFRPKRITPKPLVCGAQTAFVTGPSGEEIHTDEFGRVKVQFHWDRAALGDDTTSCWVRVAQIWAGKTWGFIFLPRIGQEVIVTFLEGDPDQPLIIGTVYNAENMPPYKLPDNKTQSGIKTDSSKGSGGNNELRFEDKKGDEKIFMHAEKDQHMRVKNDWVEYIGNDQHLHIKRDHIVKIERDEQQAITRDQIEQIGRDHKLIIAGDQSIEIKKSHSMTVTEDVAEVFKANHHEETTGDLFLHAENICIEGKTNITIKVGDSYIAIEKDGIKISTSGQIAIEATKTLDMKSTGAMTIKSDATAEMSSSATTVKSDGATTIKGATVGIN